MNGSQKQKNGVSLNEIESARDGGKRRERSKSYVASAVNRFCALIYRMFITGLFGSIFTLYSKAQKAFSKGLISSFFSDGGVLSPRISKARRIISSSIEKSRLLKFINEKLESLLSVNLSVYGLFIMIFGGLCAVFGIIDSGLAGLSILSSTDVMVGVILVLSSFPLMTSSKTLSRALREGSIMRKLLIDTFGIPEELFERDEASGKEVVPIAILLAVVLGALTYFVEPLTIIMIAFVIFSAYLILKHPEIGVLCTFFLIPFMTVFRRGYVVTVALALITLISYFIKVLCGRRRMKLELVGAMVLIFILLLGFGGLFSAGGTASTLESAVMVCLALSFVAVVNLLRSEAWLKRCISALVSSAIIVALLSIAELLTVRLGLLPSIFGKGSLTHGAINAIFSDVDAVSAYMIMVFPMLIFAIMRSERLIVRFLLFIGFGASVFSVIYLGSRPAWLGLAVGILLFMMLYSHKTLSVLLISALPAVCAFMFIPEQLKNRIFDYFSFSHASVFNRFDIWDGGIRMIKAYLFGGIGVGDSAFSEVYPIYANQGFESADSLYNVFLQILASLGVIGLAVFAIMIILYIQKSLCFMRYNASGASRLPALVCLCSLISVLAMGIAYDVFSDMRIFLVFFMIMGMGCAYIRIGDEALERSRTVTDPHDRSADLIIDIKY